MKLFPRTLHNYGDGNRCDGSDLYGHDILALSVPTMKAVVQPPASELQPT
jgi:hypothetical protein